jgi:hypothetical protein
MLGNESFKVNLTSLEAAEALRILVLGLFRAFSKSPVLCGLSATSSTFVPLCRLFLSVSI